MLATTARARVLACRGGSSAVSVNRRLPRLTAPGWPSVRQASQQARRDRDSSAALHVATCSSSSKCYALLYALASCSANQLSTCITSCVVCGVWAIATAASAAAAAPNAKHPRTHMLHGVQVCGCVVPYL